MRRSMGAGIAFVVLFVVGVLMINTPNIKSSDTDAGAAQKYVNYLSDSGHRAQLLISAWLLVLAALAFVWFTTGLRSWFASQPMAGRLTAHLGVLGAAGIAAGSTAGAVVAGSVAFGNEPVPNGDVIRIVMDLEFPLLFIVFGLASAAVIATVSVAVLRTGVLPRWVAHTGWVAVLGSLTGVFFVPLVLPLLWYLAVGILGSRRSAASAVVDRTASVPTVTPGG
ncbi:hypothetical protein [Kitasatospora sp. MAP5-34]|uniref:hypothetical protein n=1 Tax=Kitasatospora sp. MAP5-34 TaxID=3035102 RepID=UPI0024749B5E|nr:hypothetical protein [Kitasatospora sp. MAP5-34]